VLKGASVTGQEAELKGGVVKVKFRCTLPLWYKGEWLRLQYRFRCILLSVEKGEWLRLCLGVQYLML